MEFGYRDSKSSVKQYIRCCPRTAIQCAWRDRLVRILIPHMFRATFPKCDGDRLTTQNARSTMHVKYAGMLMRLLVMWRAEIRAGGI